MAQPVQYSHDVPVAVPLEEYVAKVTGQGPRPSAGDSFSQSLYSKSVVWGHEREWRIVDQQQEPEAGIDSDRSFNPENSGGICERRRWRSSCRNSRIVCFQVQKLK